MRAHIALAQMCRPTVMLLVFIIIILYFFILVNYCLSRKLFCVKSIRNYFKLLHLIFHIILISDYRSRFTSCYSNTVCSTCMGKECILHCFPIFVYVRAPIFNVKNFLIPT